jgi:hypothetical protein
VRLLKTKMMPGYRANSAAINCRRLSLPEEHKVVEPGQTRSVAFHKYVPRLPRLGLWSRPMGCDPIVRHGCGGAEGVVAERSIPVIPSWEIRSFCDRVAFVVEREPQSALGTFKLLARHIRDSGLREHTNIRSNCFFRICGHNPL